MALTSDQITAMNQATGMNKPVTPDQGAGQSRAAEIRAIAQKATPQPNVIQRAGTAIADQAKAGFQSAKDGVKELLTPPDVNAQDVHDASVGGGKVAGAAEAAAQVAKAGAHAVATAGKIAGGVGSMVLSPLAPVFDAGSKVGDKIGAAVPDDKAMAFENVLEKHPQIGQQTTDVMNMANLALPEEHSVTGTAIDKVGGGIVDTAKSATAKVGKALETPPAQPVPPPINKALQKSIQDTMPHQSKDVRIDELRATLPDSSNGKGGVTREGILGKSTPQPSAADVQRGTVAHQYIGNTKDPVAKIANVNQGIRDVSTKTDQFLDSKAAPTHFKDMIDYMETNRPTSHLQKDPGAAEAYDRATQDALDTLNKTMKDSAKTTGDFGPNASGKDIRQARIAIDQQIAKELGDNAFGTPQFKGIKAAEIDTRNLLNRMAEDMLRYPGQMEQLNKMQSFIRQSHERGIEVDMKNPAVRTSLEKEFGLNPTGEADAKALSENHKTMSDLYDARDNMIDKYQSSLGQNKVQEAIKNNPVLKAGVDVVKKVIPLGIGTHL